MTRLPHIRESNREDPDICVYCRLPWCDLFTDRPEDECPARLRAAFNAVLRWEQGPGRHEHRLILGSGQNQIMIGRMLSGYDHTLGHAILVSSGVWSELAKWTHKEAATYLCRRLGIPEVTP